MGGNASAIYNAFRVTEQPRVRGSHLQPRPSYRTVPEPSNIQFLVQATGLRKNFKKKKERKKARKNKKTSPCRYRVQSKEPMNQRTHEVIHFVAALTYVGKETEQYNMIIFR